jgi:hypothetical protein
MLDWKQQSPWIDCRDKVLHEDSIRHGVVAKLPLPVLQSAATNVAERALAALQVEESCRESFANPSSNKWSQHLQTNAKTNTSRNQSAQITTTISCCCCCRPMSFALVDRAALPWQYISSHDHHADRQSLRARANGGKSEDGEQNSCKC